MKIFLSAALLLLAGVTSTTQALNVRMHGVNYNSRKGPDWAPDASKCKSYDEVKRDMVAIKGISDRVRIYSLVDCDQAKLVLPAAKAAGVQVALGIWTTAEAAYLQTEKNKLRELLDAGLVDSNVIGLHVGSEAIYRKDITANTAIAYMNEIRDYLRSRSVNIPVTIADVIDSYYDNPQLYEAVDEISVNQFSFWERVDISEGTPKMLDRLKYLRGNATAMGKEIVISETGWSSFGSDPAASVATPANQAQFFKDFYQMATAHNFRYYWFVAFDSQWRVQNGDHQIEANFGIFKEDESMKDNFKALTIPTRATKAIRNVGTQLFLSVDGERVYMSDESDEWQTVEEQTWFFDPSTSTIRSKSSDRCLDTYQPQDGGIVRVYACIVNEPNQKWVHDAATGRITHGTYTAFCLDTDPAQNNKLQVYGCSTGNKNQQWSLVEPTVAAPVNDGSVRFFTKETISKPFAQLVRIGEEVGLGFGSQGAENSQWYLKPLSQLVQSKGSNYCLDAYEPWDGGRVHVYACNANEPNQKWTLDAYTGQLKHVTHAGFCLDADQTANNGQGKASLYWCHLNNNNQVWRKVTNLAKGVRIQSASSDGAFLEPTSEDTVVGKAASNQDGQLWFWDASTKRVISKWRNECLDAYEAWDGGRVHTYACIDGEGNQKWTYSDTTQQVKHAKHKGFCLAYSDLSAKLLQLKPCRDSDATQRIRVDTA